jgi:hypothetical protein
VGLLTGNPRLSILSVALLFLLGGGILYLVDEPDSGAPAAPSST